MSFDEYKIELENLDWYSDFSDDPTVRQDGYYKHQSLFNFAANNSNPEYRKIYNKVYLKKFSGKDFAPIISLPFNED